MQINFSLVFRQQIFAGKFNFLGLINHKEGLPCCDIHEDTSCTDSIVSFLNFIIEYYLSSTLYASSSLKSTCKQALLAG